MPLTIPTAMVAAGAFAVASGFSKTPVAPSASSQDHALHLKQGLSPRAVPEIAQPSSNKAVAVTVGAFAGLAVAAAASKRAKRTRKNRAPSFVGMRAVKTFGDGYSYDTDDLLGSGAYGRVYKCQDKAGKTWAVKDVFAGDFDALNAEIDVHKHIGKHENIVELVEAVDLEGMNDKMIVMEMAKGGELSDLMAEHGKFSEEWSKGVFKQVAFAIDHMHKKNVIHRDLKLDNILICTDSTHDADHPFVKLIDFGAAHWAREGPLQASKYIGSIQTIAPEVIVARGDDFNAGDDSQVERTHEIVYKKRPFGIRKYRGATNGKGAKVALVGNKPRYPGDPIGQAFAAGTKVDWAVKTVNGKDVSDMTMDDIIDTMGDRLLDNSTRGAFDGSFAVTGDNKGKGKVMPKVEAVELPVTVVYAEMKPKMYDAKADVWSLGSCLYQMVTNDAPFEPSEASVMAGVFKDPAGVSPQLVDLLRKMLVVDPTRRASLTEVLAHPWLQ